MKDLTPIDITQREFQRRFRGFDRVEVKAFLEEISEEIQRLLKENAVKEERIDQLEFRLHTYQERENDLKESLFAVQRLTDEMKEKARKEADLVFKDAQRKAEELLEGAHLTLAQLQGKIANLKQQKVLFESRIRAAIRISQELLDAESTEETRGPVKPEPPGEGS